jgi:hypothetical protein
MKSPAHQDRAGRRRWLSLTLAGVVGASLLAAALSLCVAVLPQRLYPPLSNADLTGLSSADQAVRREGRDRLQNDARTTLLQGLAALLVFGGADPAGRPHRARTRPDGRLAASRAGPGAAGTAGRDRRARSYRPWRILTVALHELYSWLLARFSRATRPTALLERLATSRKGDADGIAQRDDLEDRSAERLSP